MHRVGARAFPAPILFDLTGEQVGDLDNTGENLLAKLFTRQEAAAKPGEEHWHGATATTSTTHIVIAG
ncbi:MAG: hypothetical protein P4L46_03025 [Fimbriimonas sp.]|nr:hypothetical protein [Fimbriimonas sp.]